ncbi:hypothetical protein EJ05DRAFT_483283 [Pseudovirgaria hyperparasitica]|uniref:Uncharacterized protein n=1 Tax=Pseudovirgaria hyperparasitica TaxID=470096 RepID=A0A6A6WE79_9PEZI|nr:uncharacterized protein EJ05DRAFT_483283 [Pseudovirgaria hyperparasitica]KAF2760845.1 hypothetical protein EJ05DRAFT_483283 [Pseudovirgaria hyperparasitica]
MSTSRNLTPDVEALIEVGLKRSEISTEVRHPEVDNEINLVCIGTLRPSTRLPGAKVFVDITADTSLPRHSYSIAHHANAMMYEMKDGSLKALVPQKIWKVRGRDIHLMNIIKPSLSSDFLEGDAKQQLGILLGFCFGALQWELKGLEGHFDAKKCLLQTYKFLEIGIFDKSNAGSAEPSAASLGLDSENTAAEYGDSSSADREEEMAEFAAEAHAHFQMMVASIADAAHDLDGTTQSQVAALLAKHEEELDEFLDGL